MEPISRKLIYMVIISLIMHACAKPGAAPASGKVPKYKFAKKEFTLDSVYQDANLRAGLPRLDTSTYYYHYDSAKTVFTDKGTYHLLKFHKNGKVQSLSEKSLSSHGIKTLNALKPGEYQYYKIEKDTVIHMEFWRDKMAGMGYWTGIVYKDSIVFSKVNNTRQKLTYRRR
jgi:hypothetical protein